MIKPRDASEYPNLFWTNLAYFGLLGCRALHSALQMHLQVWATMLNDAPMHKDPEAHLSKANQKHIQLKDISDLLLLFESTDEKKIS